MRSFLILALMFSSLAFAGPTNYQDWATGVTDDGSATYAGTYNVDGDALAEYCFKATKKCDWRIITTVSCVEGSESAVIMNGTKQFDVIKIKCLGQNIANSPKQYTYSFTEWRVLEDNLSASGKVAFVFALKDSAVFVARFSASGSIPATASIGGPIVGERHDSHVNTSPASSTGSTVL